MSCSVLGAGSNANASVFSPSRVWLVVMLSLLCPIFTGHPFWFAWLYFLRLLSMLLREPNLAWAAGSHWSLVVMVSGVPAATAAQVCFLSDSGNWE